jgi:hypothetical protein
MVKNEDDTTRLIEAFVVSPEFQSLNRELSETTLFDVLGISLKESTHSRMLGWLLDPLESHGLGTTILRRFLYEASKLARDKPIDFGEGGGEPMTPLDAQTLLLSDLKVEDEYCLSPERRLDILLHSESEEWLCLIENKVLSEEGEEQTTDYYNETLKAFPVAKFPNRLFIYLAPEGSRPPRSRHFVRMGYSFVESLLKEDSRSASSLGRTIIDQYVQCLKGRVMEQKHLHGICRSLYRTHKPAIDYINRYGDVYILATMMARRVLEKLQDEREPAFSEIEWKPSRTSDNSKWRGIWPRDWPRNGGRLVPAYYRINAETSGTIEKVILKIHFDVGRVKDLFVQCAVLAQKDGPSMLEDICYESQGLSDLETKVEAGAGAMVALVKMSFPLLQQAFRKWEEEESGKSGTPEQPSPRGTI